MSKEAKQQNLENNMKMVEFMMDMKSKLEEALKEEETIVNFENEKRAKRKNRRANLLSEMDVKLYKKTREEEQTKTSKKIIKDITDSIEG